MAWLIDDINLSTLAFNIANRSAGWRVPAKRGDNLTIPGRNGTTWVANKPFDENSLTLNMWALGANSDGTFPADGDRQRMCRLNLDKLSAIFGQNSKLLEIVNVQSNAYGLTNEVTNPGFEAGTNATPTLTYQNSIQNPRGRNVASTTLLTNLFTNPEIAPTGVSGVDTWFSRYENIYPDPAAKLNRTIDPDISTSNYFYPSNFELAPTLATYFTAQTNVADTIVTTTSGDQSANPYGGTHALRLLSTAALSANATILSTNSSYYVAGGTALGGSATFVPVLSFRYRRAAGSTLSTIGVRFIGYDTGGTQIGTSNWVNFTIPTGTSTWATAQFTPTAAGAPFNNWGASVGRSVNVQIRTGEAWASGDGILLDQFALSVVGTHGMVNTGYWFDNSLPGPFWNGDSTWTGPAWATDDSGTPDGSISRWMRNPDDRWVPDDAVNSSSAYFVNAYFPVNHATGNTLNFTAMGYVQGTTTALTAPCASALSGNAYSLRFQARAATGAVCTVRLMKKGTGDSVPVAVSSVTFTGSGTPVANGSEMSGTVFDYEGPAYTVVSGDVLSVRVEMPSRTDGFPVFQFSFLTVENSFSRYFSGDTADTVNARYDWAGTVYNSKSTFQTRRADGFVSSTANELINRTVGGASVNFVRATAIADGKTTQIQSSNFALPAQQGIWVSADIWGEMVDPATSSPNGSGQLVLEMLDGTGTVLSTTSTSFTVPVVTGSPPKKALSIGPDQVPGGSAQWRVTAKLTGTIKSGQSIEMTNVLVMPTRTDPGLFGAPDFFDGNTTGAVWSSTANKSTSLYKVNLPTTWTAAPGQLYQYQDTPITDPLNGGAASVVPGICVMSPATTTALSQVQVTAALASAHAAGEYLVGAQFTPQVRNVSGTIQSTGDATLIIQALSSTNTVVGTASAGLFPANTTTTGDCQQAQGLLITTGSFTKVVFWFLSSATGMLSVRLNSSFLMPSGPTYVNPVQRTDFNSLYNADFFADSAGWNITNASELATAHGPGFKTLSTGGNINTATVSYDRTELPGTLLIPVGVWGRRTLTGDNLTAQARIGKIRTNLAGDPSMTGSSSHTFSGGLTGTFNDTTWSIAGTGSLKLVSSGAAGGIANVERTIGGATWATPGHTYTASVYWHTDSETTFDGVQPRLAIYVVDGGGVANATYAVSTIGNPYDGDGRATVVFTLPAAADFQQAIIRLWNNSATSGDTIFYDGLLIEETPGASSIAEVVTQNNLASRPNPTSASGGWVSSSSSAYTVSRDSAAPRRAGTWSAKGVPINTGQVGIAGFTYVGSAANSVTNIPATPGQVYTASVYWKSNKANCRVNFTQYFYDSAGTLLVTNTQSNVVTTNPANTWARQTYTTPTAPAGTAAIRLAFTISLPTGQTTLGTEIGWVTDCQIELGTTAHAYIDGDFATSGSNHYRWTKVYNASPSQQYTPAVFGALGEYFDGATGDDMTTRAGLGWEGTANASISTAFYYSVANTITISQTSYSTPGRALVSMPATSDTIQLAMSGLGVEVASAFIPQFTASTTDTQNYDHDYFPYFDGSSTEGPYGELVRWSGTVDKSVSQVVPLFVNGWGAVASPSSNVPQVYVPGSATTAGTHRGATVAPGAISTPPGSIGNYGVIPRRTVLNTARIFRLTPAVSMEGNPFLSGELAIRTMTGVSVQIQVMFAANTTAAGTQAFTQTVGSTAGSTISWHDLPVTNTYAYVQLTYTDTVAAAGHRIAIDNLMLLPSPTALGIDYPGFFDGDSNGSQWSGTPEASTSEFFGGGRRAYGEVRDAIDISSMAGGSRAEFSVNVAIPGAFWEDLLESTTVIPVTNAQLRATGGTSFSLDALVEGTAPIDDAVITVVPVGTVTGLVMTDIATGATLSLSGNVNSGGVVFDCGQFTAMAGVTSVITNVSRGGSNGFLPITPISSTEAPAIGFFASAGTGSITVTIVARRRYLVA